MNLNLTPLQILGVIIVVNGALIGGAANLTDLFGAHVSHIIVSVASLGNAIVGGIVTMFSGQGSMVRSVAAMPGVETITVNSKANQTLAQIAVDPEAGKVEATPAAEAKVAQTAKGV